MFFFPSLFDKTKLYYVVFVLKKKKKTFENHLKCSKPYKIIDGFKLDDIAVSNNECVLKLNVGS